MSVPDSSDRSGSKSRKTLEDALLRIEGSLRYFEVRAEIDEVAHNSSDPSEVVARLSQAPFNLDPNVASYVVGRYLQGRTRSERSAVEAEHREIRNRLSTMD